MKTLLFLFCLFLLLFLTFIRELDVSGHPSILPGDSGNMTVNEAYDYLKSNRGNSEVVLLDVRTQKEYNEGHIDGAELIDYYSDDFKTRIGKLATDKIYVIYCRVGMRSKKVYDMMAEMGFTKLHNVLGGILAWIDKDLPLDFSK